ncbi:MAG: DNA recombination protein RmuC [Microgenomates group bacterium]
MNLVIVILIAIVFLVIIRLWLNQIEEKSKISQELIEWLKTQSAQTEEKLSQQLNNFNSRIDNTLTTLKDLYKVVGEFSEIGRSIKDIQQFLSSPKIRGNIGEQILKDILKQHFPKDSYKLQYQFKNGEKVDAVIITSSGLIPIDSKFPLDNFKKMTAAKSEKEKEEFKKIFVGDVKKHISDIAKKYILPQEKTVDYALMYIPSENVYYEIINNEELFDYAGKMMVLPVSPMSFFAYIKAILLSFEGQKIEEKAKYILDLLSAIKKDYQKISTDFSVLNKHIANAYNQSANLAKNLNQLEQKLNTKLLE